jgi:hypothetical protein
VRCWGAEIWKLLLSRRSRSLLPERLETQLFYTGFLAFRSPANTDLLPKFKSSMASTSFHARSGGVWRAASKSSLFPICTQTPVASIETRRGRSTWVCGLPFLIAKAVPPFKPGWRLKRDNFEYRISREALDVSPTEVPLLDAELAVVYRAKSPAPNQTES